MATRKKNDRPDYKLTLMCYKTDTNRKDGGRLVTVERLTKASFKCPACGQTLVYLHEENRLGAHGAQKPGSDPDAPRPEHELRKVTELPRVPKAKKAG